ncbi:MAG: hypothetical protein FXV79_01920 [Candidatus Thioglobus sp.]|nr:MAG: hypothetical protein FXV80_05655 [Candidatus Thioglobus sp.]KAA0453507.1 MAG: hypothetical protein FXV79_01920 [Candidatus Thioglobus sp.]
MIKQNNKTIFAVLIMLMLMIVTRGGNFSFSFVHLPDFTIPAMLIAGVYFRQFWVAFVLIFSAVAIDNYAIIHQGISANCITPAYSILPLTFYGVFWSGKYIRLVIDSNIGKNVLLIIASVSIQWLLATGSYYFFTKAFSTTGWSNFPAYASQWSLVEIPSVLYWMLAIIITFTLVPRIINTLNLGSSAR